MAWSKRASGGVEGAGCLLEAAVVKELGDLFLQGVGAVSDELQLAADVGGNVGALQQSAQGGDDERERSAHVVADVGEEAHLCLVGLLLLA